MEGLIPWANQGLFFCASQGAPKLSLEDEKLSLLEDYYGGSFHQVSICDAVGNTQKYHNSGIGGPASEIGQKAKILMSKKVRQAERCGENTAHANCSMDKECERELELAREIEEEKEVEIPDMVPLKKTYWDRWRVFEVSALEELSEVVDLILICDFVAKHLQPAEVSSFPWIPDVYSTPSFSTR